MIHILDMKRNHYGIKLFHLNFYLLLIFLRKVMAATNSTTTQLQKEELNILAAIDLLSLLVQLLQEMRNDDDEFEKLIQVSISYIIH